MAAVATAAGVLSASGFAAGATPWTQALDNVAKSAPGSSQPTSGQQAFSLFPSSGAKSSQSATGNHPDPVNSAGTAGTAGGAMKAAATTAKQQPAKQQVTAKQRAAKPQAPASPYTIYDSVSPSALPDGTAAVYVNGAYTAAWSQMKKHKSVLWIDTNGSNPNANVLDVEPGDATPVGAAQWAQARLSRHSDTVAIVYTMLSDWQQVKDNMAHLPAWMQSKVRYWIADPTGVPHVVAGSSATQWYWGTSYDITTANPDLLG